jgi:hypothetical protein
MDDHWESLALKQKRLLGGSLNVGFAKLFHHGIGHHCCDAMTGGVRSVCCHENDMSDANLKDAVLSKIFGIRV